MIVVTFSSFLKTFFKYLDKSSFFSFSGGGSLINRYFININFSPSFDFSIKLSKEFHKLFKSCSYIYL